MKKYMPIIKDGIILIVVSTLFVTAVNQLFKGFKKSAEADPIVTAVQQGKLDQIQEILSQKGFDADPGEAKSLEEYLRVRANRSDEFGRTPLMRAALVNFSTVAKVVEMDKTRTEIVGFISGHGADVNLVDKDGWTALMWASWSGLEKVATTLVEAGTDLKRVDAQGNTALMIAAQRGHAGIVKMLLEKGADKAVRTPGGKSAYEFALEGKTQFSDKAPQYDSILELLGAPEAKAQGQG